MERKHVERVYGIKRVAHEIIRYNVFFFFFSVRTIATRDGRIDHNWRDFFLSGERVRES